MGRTLHHKLEPKNGEFIDNELETIHQVSKKVANSTEWTCEAFYIDPYKDDKILHRTRKSKYIIRGFTKVAGNEKNAMEVIAGLVVISLAVKNAIISVSDEGKYLKCPIRIFKGKARPDKDRIDEDISYYMTRRFNPAYKNSGYDWEKMSKELYDFKEKDKGDWIDVQNFCRYVNKKDFDNYEDYNIKQIMAGFEGEYYGLTDKDPEIESFKMSAMVKKMLPSGFKMEVTPKI